MRNFPHQLVAVEILSDNEPLEDRQFSVLQLLEQHDVFNPAKSVFKRQHESRPGRFIDISDYALDVPDEGFPPIFRICANPTELFVSGAARDALKKAGIRGLAYRPLVMTAHAAEVDVPIPLMFETDGQRVN